MRLLYHKNNKDTPFADCRKFRYLSGSKGVSLYYDVTKVLEAISVLPRVRVQWSACRLYRYGRCRR